MKLDKGLLKVVFALAFTAFIAQSVLTYKRSEDEQVEVTVNAVKAIADEIRSHEGSNTKLISDVVSLLRLYKYSNIEKGLAQTGESLEEHAAAEVILLRIFDLREGATIKRTLKVTQGGRNWPWVIVGDDARLEAFEVDRGASVGSMADTLLAYRGQGVVRRPWSL